MEWLTADVPLWAFLAALLTSPFRWTEWAKTAIRGRLESEPVGESS